MSNVAASVRARLLNIAKAQGVDLIYPVLLDDLPAPRLRGYPTYTVVAELRGKDIARFGKRVFRTANVCPPAHERKPVDELSPPLIGYLSLSGCGSAW